jgi:toxin ParE1/3/4
VTIDVSFSPQASTDLFEIYDYIAPRGGAERALAYVQRIQAACLNLASFPARGTRRDDIRPGLRVTGFEGRVTIAFHVGAERVVIVRILYAGRDLSGAFDEP